MFFNWPVTIYKENMSEEIEELRDQIGRKLDIFILTCSLHKQFSVLGLVIDILWESVNKWT